MDLRNKNILMFYPYGATKHYGDFIKQELFFRGANVIGYDERPSQHALMKIAIRLFKKKIPLIFIQYIKKILKQYRNTSFDYILVCRGEAFTNEVLDLLRKAHPKAKLILYLWDILETTNVSEIIDRFDRSMSFDPYDVKKNPKLLFRPTFFVPPYAKISVNRRYDYDILFIGTLHSKRHTIIRTFSELFEKQKITSYIYLYVPALIVFLKDKMLKYPYVNFSTVNFSPISLENTILKVEASKCILDINYSSQRSLSMRAYEALAAKRKYITTNSEIITYDFYDSNNILVVDINNPFIPKTFIDSPYKNIDEQIVHKYSVSQFVTELFDF